MSYTVVTKPTQGEATKKTLADTLIDNDTYFYNAIGGSGVGAANALLNGSFENDVDADGIPDGWTRTLYTSGSLAIETTAPSHGAKAIKFTSPGGAGNGGGYIDNDDYILCSEFATVVLSWFIKSSVADIKNIVRILWYKKDKTACTTTSTDLYNNATTNPTAWTWMTAGAKPPTDARYFKVRLVGADSSDSTAGDCFFDGIEVTMGYAKQQSFIVPFSVDSLAGTGSWVAITIPTHQTLIHIPQTQDITLRFKATLASTSGQWSTCRVKVGSLYSNALYLGSGGTVTGVMSLSVSGVLGTVQSFEVEFDGSNTADGSISNVHVAGPEEA